MAKQGTSTAVPRLRFPAFQGERWDSKPLEKVAPLQRGFDLPSSDLQPGNIPVVYSNGVQRFHSTAMARAPGLMTGRSGTIGKLHFIESGDYWPHNTSLWVTSFKGNVPKFVYFLFDSIGMGRFASGSGVPTLNRNDVHAFLSAIPQSLPEQQKIADCLTSLDEVIAAQGRKVEALKAHKRGLMQQLFPREGETRPRLRFPGFRDAPEWKIHAFDHFVAKSFYGTSSSTSEAGQYPVLRMGNMIGGGLSFSNLVYLDLDPESFEKIRMLPGDILLNRTNSLALVGKISMFDRDIECITASYIVTYRLDKERIYPAFCNLMLNTPHYQAKVNALARPSVSQANINPTAFRKELFVSVPLLAEQKRIADCLSSLDTQITAESNQLAALKTHKHGLMQQLFPSPESAAT